SAFASSYDHRMQDYLEERGVEWRVLDERETAEVERNWRSIYGDAFRTRPRLRAGLKAELEYREIGRGRFLIVPFSSPVQGLPMSSQCHSMEGFECCGEPVPLGNFCCIEFFICPPDFSWSMIHTHEDHGYGGPYFIRAEWIP